MLLVLPCFILESNCTSSLDGFVCPMGTANLRIRQEYSQRRPNTFSFLLSGLKTIAASEVERFRQQWKKGDVAFKVSNIGAPEN